MDKFEKYKNNIVNEIKTVFKDNLISLLLYGSYVRGGYIYKKSDINLLIVRGKRNNEELINLNNVFKKYNKKLNLALPLVLTLDEIKTSTDVYPMEYIDIKDFHTVLFGEDVFKDIEIELKNLRLELENQVKSKLIHLRESFVNFYNRKNVLKIILLNTLSSIIVILKNILRLNNKETTNDIKQLLIFTLELTGSKVHSIEKLVEYKKGQVKYSKRQLLSLYQGIIQEFEHMSDYVDKFKV